VPSSQQPYTELTLNIERGTRLGPYEIDAPIGAGGMGEVFRANDTRLGRAVAIKVLREGVGSHPQQRSARFQREATTISALTHPNICRLFDVGSDQGTDFLVMEYLEGVPLSLRLMRGPLPLADTLRAGAEIASALAAAHVQNIVHRDVKPSNIMLTSSGAKLLDFGLAREIPVEANTETLAGLTSENAIIGTLAYIAPEQFGGARGDPRTDIWGLGAVLYEMVTGRRAFDTPSRSDLLAAILTRDPDFDAIADPALKHLIRKCLAKDPDERWQSARDLADQLRWIAERDATRARDRSVRVAGVLATLVVLIVAGFAGWTWWRAPREKPIQKLSIAFPAGSLYRSESNGLAISPDGRPIPRDGALAYRPGGRLPPFLSADWSSRLHPRQLADGDRVRSEDAERPWYRGSRRPERDGRHLFGSRSVFDCRGRRNPGLCTNGVDLSENRLVQWTT
jgi:eukaryotic-like serine/threonine-protein kinase